MSRKTTPSRPRRKSTNGSRNTPFAVTPLVRVRLRNGRSSFLRALRSRVEKVRIPAAGQEYREKVLRVFDDAAAKYRGD